MRYPVSPQRQILRLFPMLSGILLLAVFVLAARTRAQPGDSARPGLRARRAHNAPSLPTQADTAQNTQGTRAATTSVAIKAQDINILSPSDATITVGKSAVYRITINPDDAAQNYCVTLDYDHTAPMPPHDVLQYLPGPGVPAVNMPVPIYFAPGQTYRDVTIVATGTTPSRHTLYAYKEGEFKTFPSATLIVTNASASGNSATRPQGTGAQPVLPAAQGASEPRATASIFTGGARPIPISCLVPTDPIQTDSEGFDCTAGINLLGLGAGALQAEGAGEKRHHKAVSSVLVDCSLPDVYRPGKGLIPNPRRGSKGWPATLEFTHKRRQQTFAVEPRAGAKNASKDVQLMFYQMPFTTEAALTAGNLIFTKSIDISAP